MDYSRRDLSLLLPALFAAQAAAADTNILPSKVFPFEELPVKASANGNKTYQVFTGETHDGYPIDMHITELPPGSMPHPAHHHVHEEMVMIVEGALEVTILGKSTKIGPSGLAYVHSNEEHGWKNVGETPARYFVLAIGRQSA
jgi:quercetin dioxygenase-like cupin family protein